MWRVTKNVEDPRRDGEEVEPMESAQQVKPKSSAPNGKGGEVVPGWAVGMSPLRQERRIVECKRGRLVTGREEFRGEDPCLILPIRQHFRAFSVDTTSFLIRKAP